MELLVLLLAVPVVLFVLFPARLVAGVRKHPFTIPALVLVLLVAGALGLRAAFQPPVPQADYTQGDAALRAMLE